TLARYSLWHPRSVQDSGLRGDRYCHSHDRDRGYDRHFQCGVCGTVTTLALRTSRPIGADWSTFDKSAASRAPTSGPALTEIRARTRLIQDLAGIWVGTGTFTGGDNPQQIKLASITPNFLSMLGVKPALGRVLHADDERKPVMVLSNALWRGR